MSLNKSDNGINNKHVNNDKIVIDYSTQFNFGNVYGESMTIREADNNGWEYCPIPAVNWPISRIVWVLKTIFDRYQIPIATYTLWDNYIVMYDGQTIRTYTALSQSHTFEIEKPYNELSDQTKRFRANQYNQLNDIFVKLKAKNQSIIMEDVLTAFSVYKAKKDNNHGSVTEFAKSCKKLVLNATLARLDKISLTPRIVPRMADKLKETSRVYTEIFGQITARKTP